MKPNRIIPLLALVAVCTASPPLAAQPQPLPKLVVMELVSERGLDEGTVRLLNELLLTEFQRSNEYEVVGISDVLALMENEIQKEQLGCSDAACLVQIGGMLGADFLAHANIGRIGGYYLLNVKIMNVHSGKVERRWSEQVEGIEDELMSSVRKSVDALTGQGAAGRAAAAAAEDQGEQPAVTAEAGQDRGVSKSAALFAGSAVALAVGAGVVLALAKNQESVWQEEYDAYQAATTAEAATLRYDSATKAAELQNTLAYTGWGLAAAAAIAGGISGYLFLSVGDDAAPQLASQPTPGGALVLLRGSF